MESEPLYLRHTLIQLGCMSERGSVGTSERDHLSEIIFMFSGFNFIIGALSISKAFVWFSPLWFPQGKFFMSLVSCDFWCACYSLRWDPRSYFLNDKNLTGLCWRQCNGSLHFARPANGATTKHKDKPRSVLSISRISCPIWICISNQL